MILSPSLIRLCAVLSGVMLTASFPPGRLDGAAWFALVPLLVAIPGQAPGQAFRLGLVAGLTHYLTLIYWVVVVLEHYGGLHLIISLVLWLLLCLYLSLYPALFACLASWVKDSRYAACSMAGLWVGLEYVRAWALSGFPWCLLGHTQYTHPMLIQISDTVGAYGLSFLIVLSNGVIYTVLFSRRPSLKGVLGRWEWPLLAVLWVITLAYGHYRLTESEAEEKGQRSVRVAIIQGNIEQSMKWDPGNQEKTIRTYYVLSHEAMAAGAALIVWPETAVPLFFQEEGFLGKKVREVARNTRADLVFGSPAYVREGAARRYYNRAYHLSPDGTTSGHYDKVHLVPFGEYVPLKRFFPFVHRLVAAAGDFASGQRVAPIPVAGLPSGILICFEVIFPELARAHTLHGAEILINLTNDAWFGMTSAPYQHLATAVFRAVENRRPMIRAANTGFSAFIDAAGRIRTVGGLFHEDVLVYDLGLAPRSLTFYTRYGDSLMSGLGALSLIHFFYVLWYDVSIRRKKRTTAPR